MSILSNAHNADLILLEVRSLLFITVKTVHVSSLLIKSVHRLSFIFMSMPEGFIPFLFPLRTRRREMGKHMPK